MFLVALAMAAFYVGSGKAQPVSHPALAPLLNEGSPAAVPGQYIVVFRRPAIDSPESAARERALDAQVSAAEALAQRLGAEIRHRYRSAIKGFSARLPPAALAAVRAFPGVDWVEANQRGTLDAVQQYPPYGLDRTSERLLPLDYRYTYSGSGQNVHVYVLDTGITNHVEFGNRLSYGFSAFGGSSADCSSIAHGTHVAGIIGSEKYGIAKQVTLHAVRVFDCGLNGTHDDAIYGINWMVQQTPRPAVANLSAGYPITPALENAINYAIVAKGYTFTVSAGNQSTNACNYSPARMPAVITVGSVEFATDTNTLTGDNRANLSNYGPCLDLFAPGVDILSTMNANNAGLMSGTSMAAPHVAGVAALYLETNPAASPATVWGAIDHAANVFGGANPTPGWPGIVNPGPGSPNKLLHWGSGSSDGTMDGDAHLTTVDGLRYDFQAAGEFVYLRDTAGTEIQVRQSPVATDSRPGFADPYDGLSTCVSVVSGVAARVGTHRVTLQPNLSGTPDPSSLQFRVDGVLQPLPAAGLNLGGGIVRRTGADVLQIDFADGTTLIAVPGWWSGQNLWFLNVDIFRTSARRGLLGQAPPGSWLPALPNGASVGAMPAGLHQRYQILYGQFADAWRVTNGTSLFDYRTGTSTVTFTNRTWPTESGRCLLPRNPVPPAQPLDRRVAEQACAAIENRQRNAHCIFDVAVTGERGFARTYLLAEEIRARLTRGQPAEERQDSAPD